MAANKLYHNLTVCVFMAVLL